MNCRKITVYIRPILSAYASMVVGRLILRCNTRRSSSTVGACDVGKGSAKGLAVVKPTLYIADHLAKNTPSRPPKLREPQKIYSILFSRQDDANGLETIVHHFT